MSELAVAAAPIVLFAYNRPAHLRRTLLELSHCAGAGDSDLTIFCDGPKNPSLQTVVSEVAAIARGASGFKSLRVVERSHNMGLARSVIAGVSEVIAAAGRAIVLEDDIVCAPQFLEFINKGLSFYKKNRRVFSLTGYTYPFPVREEYPWSVYAGYRSSSWGWATWADRWNEIDWDVRDYQSLRKSPSGQLAFARGGGDLMDMLNRQMRGELDSWAIRFAYAHAKHNAYCIYPIRTLVENIGFDGSGTHCGVSSEYDARIAVWSGPFRMPLRIEPDKQIMADFAQVFQRGPLKLPPPFWKRVLAVGPWIAARLKTYFPCD